MANCFVTSKNSGGEAQAPPAPPPATGLHDTDNLHNVTFTKNLLEYSGDFARSVGKNSLWYLDTDRTTANSNIGFEELVKVEEPLMLPDTVFSKNWKIKCQFPCNFELNDDDELIHMTDGTDRGRVVVDRFVLWVHKLTPRDSRKKETETEFKYMREMC